MSNGSNCEISDSVTVATLIKERDDMHKVVLNLRTAVSEIGKYLLNCEDELNKTLIQSMISNFTDGDVVAADHENSLDCDSSLAGDKSNHVHFAPDVSTIVEGDFLLDCIDKRHDISIEIRNELEACMKRLKSEAAAVLQLTAAAKPPSAATETTPLRSVESRRLASVTRQLVDKNKQIKELEAQLKLAHQTIAKYEQDLAEIRADLEVEKAQREKDKANSSLESVYADKDLAEQAGIDSHFQNLSQLQEKARTMVNESSECVLPQHTMAIVEEMCHHVDHILEEARKEKEDLQSQIDSADKQLRNTRKFLDDQANERELERDEFTRAITKLKQQLQDKERDWMSKERFASERSAFQNGSLLSEKVEALEQKVQETTNLLKETEEKKDAIDRELKEADQKVLVLKEVIRDLECQDRTKTQRQMTLEQRLDELERELESQKIDQNAMVLELEAMQNGSPRDINLKQLEEHFKKQFNPNVVEQMKSQLREMARSIQRQTKYMEGLNVHVSSASLSSPSEDISIREQLDLFKCQTPEGCRSPLLSLPTDEISLLQDQLTRHTKIEEIAMKRIKDQEMQLNSLQSRYEDVLAEKEVLQVKCDKQLSTIASTKTTLDEVRRRAEWQQNKCDAINLDKIAVLEKEVHTLQNSIRSKEREVATHQQQISNLQRIVADKEVELCNYVDSQNNQVEFLQQKLKFMEIEKEKMIVMLNKMREGHNISLPALMEELLAEKNADIDYLEQMVKELRDGHVNTSFVESQNSSKKSSNSNSKGYRVSFADDVEVSHMNDGERTRDANFSNVMHDFSPHFSSTVKTLEKSEQRMITPLLHPIAEDDSRGGGDCTPSWQRMSPPRNDINQQEEMKIRMDELEKELIWKTELIDSYEKRLQEIPQLEGELKRARDDLASTISEISEDKKYYQERLELMTTLQKQLNERDSEVQDLKNVIAEREENLVRVMSDVKSLQLILEKSQKKIEDAKKAAVSDDTKRLSEEVERLKDENIHHVQEILVLKKELNKIPVAEINLLKENLNDEKNASEKLRNEVSSLLNEKEAVIAELEASKQRYQSLKKELENASSKLLMTEKEIDKLHNDLESSTELNDVLKNKLYEANHEINLISRKMSSEMSNRIQKDSNDLLQMKDELERLRSINRSLESDCESLKKELNNMIGEANAMARISENNSKAKELEVEVDKLRDEREMLLQSICTMKEKFDTEKSRCETIISAAEAYKNSETLAQEKVLKEKELRISAEKKSQFLKREYEKLKRAKKELEKKNTVLKDELDKEKKHTMELENSPMRGRKTLADLQVTPVDAIEIVPFENKITGSIDDLTDQLQNELDMSARLDDTLLSTLDMQANSPQPVLPSQSLVAVLHRVIKHGFKNLTREEMDHLYEELTLHTHRPPRIADLMERINKLQNELRKQLKNVDNLHEEVDVERSSLSKEKERVVHLETEIDRLQKIISYQEERLASLSSVVEQNRTQMSDLKLSLLKEKGNFKKLHVLFEGERDKIKQIQKEDTELIEDLRICLEKEKDSKVRLQLCLEQERERLQTLEAQLNAAQAAEQIVPRPPNQSDHLNKCLDEWRGKLTEIGVELEREKRHVDSLSAALNKEKEENDHLRTELYKKSSECIDLQAEVEQLKCEIGKERSSNREMNEKLKTIQEAEMRRQRNRAAAEEKHKRALERAKIQKRDLEAEVTRLKTQLVTIKGEEALPSWSDDVESEPLLNQIKDVNLELEKLGREKKQLTSTVKALLEENEHLELLISQSTGKQFPESELSYFISLYIRSKGHRKALVWQKRYLMLSLQGYQDEGQRLAMKISSSLCVNRSWIPQVSVASRPSFKHAALVIIAITRMKKIMNCRKVILGIHYKTQSPMKEHLIRRKLKLSSPTNDKILTVHSPIREIDFLTSPQRNLDGKSEGLLKPTRLADYLETFNKLQARLSQALSPPDNISLGLESKILSKVSN
ncbi:centromere-associated protein E-like isoform X2 [Nilaparvata lugens]|uniref:centromere-associated protein E-like isoform X2 n=1 Tax=Nilaparvata lugens TaxID=108931 RepID=UPI00193CBD90|nr:centromere-associated protein E-like isoform X2 [Nilaparvata lugens]